LERVANDPQRWLFFPEELPLESSAFEKTVDEDVTAKINNLVNEATVIEGPMEVVEKIFSHMGYDRIFGNSARDVGNRTLLKQLLGGILARPSSKLSMSEWFEAACAIDVSEDRIYHFLDALQKREDRVKKVVRENSEGLFSEHPTLMLFDVTTLYNESFEEDSLRKNGYSKDNKVNETQTVLALATTPEGLPLWYELFPGNTYEGDTFRKFADTWRREEYPGSEGVVVADSAMFSSLCLESLKGQGLHYVIGARLKSLNQKMKDQIHDSGAYKELPFAEDSVRYIAVKHGTDNLLITWSKNRAIQDEKKRERFLARLEKKQNKTGKLSSGMVKPNRGAAKYLKIADGEEPNRYVIDEEKIAMDAKWDGLHGVLTDMPVTEEEEIRTVLSHYHSLWRIEESFRIKKSGLKIRPIYHYKRERILGHVALIYMAYACVRHLQARVELLQKAEMSVEEIRKALMGVTSSLIRDKSNGKLYRFPKEMRPEAGRIYKSLGLKRGTRPMEITSTVKYRSRKKYLRDGQEETVED
jgi:transposase